MTKQAIFRLDQSWLIPLLLALGAITLFILSLDDRRKESFVTSSLSSADELAKIQVRLHTNVLKSRLFYLNHFDSLANDQRAMLKASSSLIESVEKSRIEDVSVSQKVKNLHHFLLEKDNLIESFKTSLSVYKNSEQYIGIIIGEFLDQSQSQDFSFLVDFAQFHNSLSSFRSRPSLEKQEAINDLLQKIRDRGQGLTSRAKLILEQIIDHSQLIIKQAELIDGQISKILLDHQDDIFEAIQEDLLREQQSIRASLKKYELALYIIVVALTLYTFFILVKLKLSNDLLELRVKERTQELKEASQKAIDADEAKSAFLAHMSHEIRTPLNGVIGMTSILLKKDLASQEKEMIAAISYCGKSLLALINDILDFSKIEANKLKLDIHPFSLSEVIDESIAIVSINAKTQNVLLLKDISPDVPSLINGDRNRIAQILLNLLSNAIKFSKNGKVEVKLEAKSSTQNIYQLTLSVIDNGIGITHEQLKNLFQDFTQADQSISSSFGGTGLGLAISKKLAELMGGKITVRSQYGAGSTFSLVFTATGADQPSAELAEMRSVQKLSESYPHTILVVDDNFINRKVASDILKSLGYTPEVAKDGFQALALISKRHYDIIFTDLRMPEMDGYEFVKKVNADHRQPIRFVAMTASATVEEKEKCLKHGISSFISKPINERDLVRILSDKTEA